MPVPMTRRGLSGRLADTIFFPLRAVCIPEDSRWGLSSLRDERMRLVAAHCTGRTLDIGCGPGNMFANSFYPDATGVDVFAYPGVSQVVPDMAALPYADATFDTVTLIAVGGHIPRDKRTAQFAEIARVLRPGGRLLMTEGEPVTQTLSHEFRHLVGKVTGKKGMDDLRGMEEEEQYCMPFKELMGYLNAPPLRLTVRRRFMWCLNNLYIAAKA